MSPTRRIALWFSALVVGATILAVLGLRGLSADAERVEEQLRRQASGFARGLADAFESEAFEFADDAPGVVAFKTDADGTLQPLPTKFGAARELELSALREEIDEFERNDDIPGALKRLATLTERTDVPQVAAWALATTGALRARRGENEAARAAWTRVIDEHPDTVDERGMPRSLVARWMVCELDGFPAPALSAFLRDAIEQRASVEQVALGALIERALEKLREVNSESHADLLALNRERQFERRLRSSWPRGISNWLAAGADRGHAWFELVDDPLDPPDGERVFVRVETTSTGFRGQALSSTSIARAAFARPEITAWRELGFEAGLLAPGARILAGAATPLDADAGWERLPEPNDDIVAIARSRDIERARREARQRFWMLAALSALALLVAASAAWLGVRALGREARAAHQREQFVAAVTHELKAPLASIRLLAELLEQGGVAEAKVREFGARTVSEADRLSRLISSVLEIARLERGAPPRERGEVVLRQLALETLRQFEPIALEKHVAVKLHPVDEDLRVLAHADAIRGALFELLTNASKYAASSDIEVKIERRGERAVLSVLDRGQGVAADDVERIFEPFQRLGEEATREQAGVGLGLALVRKVAESHGGTARCASRPGGGSVFELELPLESQA